MINLSQGLSAWQALVRRHGIDPTTTPTEDDDTSRETAEERQARIAMQKANRNAAYLRRLPDRYAEAEYGQLKPHQNPRNMVGTWLDNGPRVLLLVGPSRTGKTTAAYAVANDAHNRGDLWVIARPAGNLAKAVHWSSDEPLALQYAIDCDLLVIDDLGRERMEEHWLDRLQQIVDARCASKKRLIVTANTSADKKKAFPELVERYGHPVVERLIDGGGVIVFDGPAIRDVVTEW